MPLHDWKDERGWDSVHPIWLTYLVEWVQPLLAGRVQGIPRRRPFAYRWTQSTASPMSTSGDWDRSQPRRRWRRRRLSWSQTWKLPYLIRLDPQRAVHIDFHGQLIAAIEIVSPRNKDRADSKETYSNRYLGYLRLGVHLMLVDVLPRPKGFSFADAITNGLGMKFAAFAAAVRRRLPRRRGQSRSATTWAACWPSGVGRCRWARPYRRCRCR